MKFHSSKSEAIQEAQARRAAGEIVKIMQSRQWIPGSGDHVGYTAIRYFVEVSA